DARRDLIRREAEALRAERDLVVHAVRDESLERVLVDDRHAQRGERVRPRDGGVASDDLRRAGERTPGELRDDALAGAEERALAASARTAHDEHLAGHDVEIHVAERRLGRVGVPEREAPRADGGRRRRRGQRTPARRSARIARYPRVEPGMLLTANEATSAKGPPKMPR